jgi:SAM-dependent methyltransferase
MAWRQLRDLPAFQALVRSQEGWLFSRLGPLEQPALDLGCGDGHFAHSVWGAFDAGVDAAWRTVVKARKLDAYRLLCAADAACLPYRSGSFSTVISNCVWEHIPKLEPALEEAHRVLVPGGKLVISVPVPELHEWLAIARLLAWLRLHKLKSAYQAWFAKIQAHFHQYSAPAWTARLEAHGFQVFLQEHYLSRRAVWFFDLGHFLGLPNLAWHRLTGRWVLFPWAPLFCLERRFLRRELSALPLPSGGGVFLAAIKKGRT